MEVITGNTVQLIISIVTVAIVILMFFRKPQKKQGDEIKEAEKRIAVHTERTDQKFIGVNKELVGLRDIILDFKRNDLHSMEVRQDQFAEHLIKNTNELVKLSTVIDERIPKAKGK